MKRLGAFVLMVAAAVVLSGAANGTDLPDLEVGSLTLKDKDGKVRATLSVASGSPALALFDKDKTLRAWLGVVSDGSVTLDLFDKDGNARAAFAVLADGSPGLALNDKDGELRVALKVVDGSPGLGLYDQDGMTRAAFVVGANGSPALTLGDRSGRARATLGVTTTVDKRTGDKTKTTEGTLTLFDAKGDVLWQAPR
ncbi:MAG: hypothetical protein ACE10D_06975 [Planctomycetota bacterium]